MNLKINPKVRADAARVDDDLVVLKGEVFQVTAKEGKELLKRPWRSTRH